MKKILLSLSMLAAVAVVVVGATTAFFSDTETSTGNTFTAGAIDLKVDSTSHYNNMVCTLGDSPATYTWQPEVNFVPTVDHYPVQGSPCDGTWTETDLGARHKFFNLVDVKPGDNGEDTISLHVYSNDSWGRFVISGVTDLDNTCTEPESEVGALEPECPAPSNVMATTPGELAESISFWAWLDQGAIPGFQNVDADGDLIDLDPDVDDFLAPDPTEGDNIQQCDDRGDNGSQHECDEPTVIQPGTVDENPSTDQTLADETHNIWPALAGVWDAYCWDFDPQGANGYNECQGIAEDGRLVGSTTYYFGLAWNIPYGVGNEAQTDSLNANLSFQAVQQRNNPGHTF